MKFKDEILKSKFRHKTIALKSPEQFQEFKEQPERSETITQTITDTEGLRRAYAQGDYFVFGDTMYIAGSHTLKDWYDDFTKIPVFGDLRNSTRYQRAKEALLDNPQVKTVVGHSLGGSVALELEKNYKHITKSRTFGAPVFDLMGNDPDATRYRNWTDVVSIFDRSAKRSIKWNPFESSSLTHDFGNIAGKFNSSRTLNVSSQNPDNTVSLIA